MTTLTVPGAVPEGLPGTGSPRPQGPGRGKGPHGPHRGTGGNGSSGPNRGNAANGPGSGQGKKRGRGNRHRRGPKSDVAPGNGEPRVSRPAEIDDDIGNRLPGTPRQAPTPRDDAPRAAAPVPHVDDDIGNRKPKDRNPSTSPGNEAPRAVRPSNVDDDFGNR